MWAKAVWMWAKKQYVVGHDGSVNDDSMAVWMMALCVVVVVTVDALAMAVWMCGHNVWAVSCVGVVVVLVMAECVCVDG